MVTILDTYLEQQVLKEFGEEIKEFQDFTTPRIKDTLNSLNTEISWEVRNGLKVEELEKLKHRYNEYIELNSSVQDNVLKLDISSFKCLRYHGYAAYKEITDKHNQLIDKIKQKEQKSDVTFESNVDFNKVETIIGGTIEAKNSIDTSNVTSGVLHSGGKMGILHPDEVIFSALDTEKLFKSIDAANAVKIGTKDWINSLISKTEEVKVASDVKISESEGNADEDYEKFLNVIFDTVNKVEVLYKQFEKNRSRLFASQIEEEIKRQKGGR